MITTGDARNILFLACKEFGIKDIVTSWAIPTGKIMRDRIVVVSPTAQEAGTYWETCYLPVNFCVPDIGGEANLIRLDELERIAKTRFQETTYGTFNGSAYTYQAERIGREEDKALGCHYIYVSIYFKVLNIKNL